MPQFLWPQSEDNQVFNVLTWTTSIPADHNLGSEVKLATCLPYLHSALFLKDGEWEAPVGGYQLYVEVEGLKVCIEW